MLDVPVAELPLDFPGFLLPGGVLRIIELVEQIVFLSHERSFINAEELLGAGVVPDLAVLP